MTDKQRATADKVDGILLESGSDFAGLLELQRSGIPRFRVLSDWRVSGDRSDESSTLIQLGTKSLIGIIIVFWRPHFASGGISGDDRERVGQFGER